MRFLTILLLSISVLGMEIIQWEYPTKDYTQDLTFKFNEGFPTFSKDTIELLSFGYSRMFTNLLWIRFLQQTPNKKVPPGELSWIYFDLDTISSVDPDFLPVFTQGATFLSVITEDKIGADRLFSKGVKLFPYSWKIRANYAYHLEFELNQPDRAAEQYILGSKISGAAPILGILAAHHLNRLESNATGILFLEHLMQTTQDEEIRKRFQERIDFWRANGKKESFSSPNSKGKTL